MDADGADHPLRRSENLKRIEGQVLQENTTMLDMCRQLGFEIGEDPSDRSVEGGEADARR